MKLDEAMDNLRLPKTGDQRRIAEYLYDAALEEAAKVAEDMGRTKGYACGIAVSNEIRNLKTQE